MNLSAVPIIITLAGYAYGATVGLPLAAASSTQVVAAAEAEVVLHDADPRWADTIDWALDQFTSAGLVAPGPDINVHVDSEATECLGYPAVFTTRDRGPRIDICIPYQDSKLGTDLRNKLVLHELAHAWTRQNLDDSTRQAFMELRGSTRWNDHNQVAYTRGIERAAIAISYGLLPDAPPNSTNTCGFELLTQTPLPNDQTERCRP